jgi:glycosyltransferase involved in cell wall biosynthesis
MDLLFVGGLPPFRAGSAISLYQLLGGLVAAGHTVRALTPVTPDTLAEGERFRVAHPAVPLHWIRLDELDYTPDVPAPEAYRQRERAELWRVADSLLQERRPDLVVCGHESWGWHVPELAGAHDLPCLQLVRGNPIRGILEGTYPEAAGARLLAELRKAAIVVAPASHMADGLGRLGFDARAVPNAIDLGAFAPRPPDPRLARALGIGEGDIVVACVGNLKAIKRPLDVVESAALALRRDPRLRYLFVGDGVLRGAVEDACRRHRIASRVRLTGWVDYAEVPAHVNLADVVVLASEGEGMARVYLEAQACAKVLIASDVAAAREVIEPGRTGFLFPVGDAGALAAQTLGAAADPEGRREIGRRALARVQAHDLRRAVAAYGTLMDEVVARHGAGAAARAAQAGSGARPRRAPGSP